MSILLDGLSLGAIYALIALGYTMVYGIAKMLNFAHGDVIMVGAYTVLVSVSAGMHPYLGLLLAVVFCALLGIVIEKLAYKPLRAASPLAVLITAIGVSYFLQGLAQLIFGSQSKTVTIKSPGSLVILGSEIDINIIITLVVGVILMAALTLFIKKTKTGRAMIAVSEDKGAAQLMGINVNRIITITFAIGSGLAAFAGLFYLMLIPSVTPTLGSMPGIKAFTAAVIGGIGSIPGAMLGGILLGLVEKICQSIPALQAYTTAVEFLFLIVILLVKPVGLLGKKRRVKV